MASTSSRARSSRSPTRWTTLDLSGNRLRALPDDLPRLRALRTLFCSTNPFETLPAVLGHCPSLDIVGFKANAILHVPAKPIRPRLRWLILSDNRIEAMPESLGDCRRLRKLALAGNRLTALPAGIALRGAGALRLSANRFARLEDALPEGLLALPRLTWLAYAGNPFNAAQEARRWRPRRSPDRRGRSCSSASCWAKARRATSTPRAGGRRAAATGRRRQAVQGRRHQRRPAGSEMAACIAADVHAHVIGVRGPHRGPPAGRAGPGDGSDPAALSQPGRAAQPGQLHARRLCARRCALPARRRARSRAARATRSRTCTRRGCMHGDFYAHNLLVDDEAHALLGDFGAASFLPEDDAGARRGADAHRPRARWTCWSTNWRSAATTPTALTRSPDSASAGRSARDRAGPPASRS